LNRKRLLKEELVGWLLAGDPYVVYPNEVIIKIDGNNVVAGAFFLYGILSFR
jgi:hypothetical protein